MPAPIITITDRALKRITYLLSQRGQPSAGIKVSVRTKGCAGLAYAIEYADTILPGEEVITQNEVTVVIDPKAVMYLIGTTMDYLESPTQSGFTFINPNAKSSCGCGESFNV